MFSLSLGQLEKIRDFFLLFSVSLGKFERNQTFHLGSNIRIKAYFIFIVFSIAWQVESEIRDFIINPILGSKRLSSLFFQDLLESFKGPDILDPILGSKCISSLFLIPLGKLQKNQTFYHRSNIMSKIHFIVIFSVSLAKLETNLSFHPGSNIRIKVDNILIVFSIAWNVGNELYISSLIKYWYQREFYPYFCHYRLDSFIGIRSFIMDPILWSKRISCFLFYISLGKLEVNQTFHFGYNIRIKDNFILIIFSIDGKVRNESDVSSRIQY